MFYSTTVLKSCPPTSKHLAIRFRMVTWVRTSPILSMFLDGIIVEWLAHELEVVNSVIGRNYLEKFVRYELLYFLKAVLMWSFMLSRVLGISQHLKCPRKEIQSGLDLILRLHDFICIRSCLLMFSFLSKFC